jgi:hypothetical protein
MLIEKITSYLSHWMIAMGCLDYRRVPGNGYISLMSYTGRPRRDAAGRRVYIIQSFHKKN